MTARSMPRPALTPQVAPRTIGALMLELKDFDPAKASSECPWADRFAMGLPLAPWQRDFKWSEERSRRFITSAWTGVHLGTYVVTDMELRPAGDGFDGVEYEYLTNCVIEGQQRLKTLELYLTDQLAVPDASGDLALWSEVAERDQRRFGNVHATVSRGCRSSRIRGAPSWQGTLRGAARSLSSALCSSVRSPGVRAWRTRSACPPGARSRSRTNGIASRPTFRRVRRQCSRSGISSSGARPTWMSIRKAERARRHP